MTTQKPLPSSLDTTALLMLFTALWAITPVGWLPYVTLTSNPEQPLGAVIVDAAGNLAATGTGESVDSLVAHLRHRLAQGCGEWPA